MGQLGYKPTTKARGVGEMLPDTLRVTRIGSFAQGTWVTHIGMRLGRSTATATVAKLVTYNYAALSPTTLVHATPSIAVNTFMPNNDPSAGMVYEVPVTGLYLLPGQVIAGGVFNDGPGSLAYGQSNSGAMMFFDTGSAVTDPFNEDTSSPQGDMDIYYIGVSNRQPSAPEMITPVAGEQTVDTTPLVQARFVDADVPLGDYVSAYLIEVWDAANTTRVQTTGVVTTDSTEKATGIIDHTLTALTSGAVYTLRVYTYDRGGVQSPARVTPFTVQAGGAIIGSTIASSAVIGTASNGDLVANTTTPAFSGTWTHQSGTALATVYIALQNADTGVTVRSGRSIAKSVANNGAFSVTFAEGTAWTALPAGTTRYRYYIVGLDALGAYTGEYLSKPFVVNGAPVITIANPPDDTQNSGRATLYVLVADASDDVANLTVVFRFGPTGGALTSYPATYFGSSIYTVEVSATMAPTLGTYDWNAVVTDPWGASVSIATRQWVFVAEPTISGIYPANGGTITTGTPTILATVDRTATIWQITIADVLTGVIAYQPGAISVSGTSLSHAVPGGKLLNNRLYELRQIITTSDGLVARPTTTFTVDYPAPAHLANVTWELVESSIFDRAAGSLPGQLPNFRFAWTAPSTGVVPTADWKYVVVYRIGGGQDRRWRIYDRGQTQFIDTSAPGNVSLTYFIGFVRAINSGQDIIESELVFVNVIVPLRHTVITSEDPNDPAVTMHLWEDRSSKPVTDVQVTEILGQRYPDTWHSPLDYETIDGEWLVRDSPAGDYTAQDAIDVMQQLRRPVLDDATGKLIPRTLYYRDPQQRTLRFVVTDFQRSDLHDTKVRQWSLSGVEVDRESIIPASVNIEDAVDGTAGPP